MIAIVFDLGNNIMVAHLNTSEGDFVCECYEQDGEYLIVPNSMRKVKNIFQTKKIKINNDLDSPDEIISAFKFSATRFITKTESLLERLKYVLE